MERDVDLLNCRANVIKPARSVSANADFVERKREPSVQTNGLGPQNTLKEISFQRVHCGIRALV
jgi:hypothetical protein